jgi:hypothetical protein
MFLKIKFLTSDGQETMEKIEHFIKQSQPVEPEFLLSQLILTASQELKEACKGPKAPNTDL